MASSSASSSDLTAEQLFEMYRTPGKHLTYEQYVILVNDPEYKKDDWFVQAIEDILRFWKTPEEEEEKKRKLKEAGDLKQLQQAFEQLQDDYKKLQDDYKRLQDDYKRLQDDYDQAKEPCCTRDDDYAWLTEDWKDDKDAWKTE